MTKTDVLIIGAGVTGLSCAGFLRYRDYLILEKENQPGGYCRTVNRNGYVWDYSGHFFHFQRQSIMDYVLAGMDLARPSLIEKRSQVYFHGRHVDFPFQKNIHQLPKPIFIDCLYDLFFRPTAGSSNFKEMLINRFGSSICSAFLFPYNEKVYCCDLATLDQNAMGRFFPSFSIEEIVKNFKNTNNTSYNSTFLYPSGGAYEYIKSLLTRIDPNRLYLNEEAVKIDLDRRTVETSVREIGYKYLISSIPFPAFLKKACITFPSDIYSYSKVLVFNLGFDCKGSSTNHWVYFPSNELVFYRVGFYDNIFGSPRMSLYVEVGFNKDEQYDEEQILTKVLNDLTLVGILDGHNLVDYHSVLLDPAYVHVQGGAMQDSAKKIAELRGRGVFCVGRYGGWKYCSIEDNIIEAEETAEILSNQ